MGIHGSLFKSDRKSKSDCEAVMLIFQGSEHHHALRWISDTEDHSTSDTHSIWKKFSIWKFPYLPHSLGFALLKKEQFFVHMNINSGAKM